MASLVLIGVYAVVGLSALSLLTMIGFGFRSIASGKVNMLSMVVLALPFVLMVVFGFVLGDWTRAAILTLVCVAVIAALGIVLSSFRSLFI